MNSTAAPVLRLTGISKRFGSVQANQDISLQLHAGEVLALLGENGAGKSTLMSILFGHYVADTGTIEAFGQPLPPGNPRAALAAGIGMVHQHFALADNLSVLDNVVLGTEPLLAPQSKRRAARDKLLAVAAQFGLPVAPEARVADLGVGERQRVEILKALYRGARILILDEPTAVLTPQESEALFDTLQQMVAQGLAIVFISHKLAEVLRVSHRIAVLRGGKLVAEMPAAGATQMQLASAMVGHPVTAGVRQPTRQVGETVCTLAGVHTADGLQGVGLALRAGEIVAVAGVSGNGQGALAALLCGTTAASRGEAQLLGQPLRTHPAWLVRHGVARIPEDRHGTGVVGDLPVWENAIAERLHAGPGPLKRWGFVRRGAARSEAARIAKAFDVRGGGLDVPARSLSGGNMQKLILGRVLAATGADGQPQRPRLIVAHQPTWGLDIGAVTYVQQQLLAARDAGAAVLLISDDLDEVMLLGDRIAVMHAGHLTEALPAGAWTRDTIGLAMAGSHAPATAAPSVERVGA
ncbi:ABC transporter ATP-binding protein [Corticibacter populi]|uniref:ABC transporter ATP-binding protein n=1 Tax=Corticibacter populi TaxID=1550736 RepID=A0A3M6QQL3_9BURK|nr:ABC transporter ATP-binding protein [Corticibacter populi]RMX05081.1 ABC transporter ATP-binding protein [Corticibacter populi]